MRSETKSAIVIGAGIAGACCAAYLQKRGVDVLMIDRLGVGEGTSFGNAGSLSPDGIMPVATPGMATQVPKWLLDPRGPLSVRWTYLPWAIGWLARFLVRANSKDMESSAVSMKLLAGRVYDCYRDLLPAEKYRDLIRHTGSLYVYDSVDARRGDDSSVELRRRYGAVLEEIGEEELHQMEPDLSRRFKCAYFAPNAAMIVNPQRLTQTIVDEVLREGARFVKADVQSISRRPDGTMVATTTTRDEFAADFIVVAAGAWSHKLAAQLGEFIPLESQRGYHITLANPGVSANRLVSWGGRKTIATPMEMGMRFAGTVEIAGLAAAPNWARADLLLEAARDMYPNINESETSRWMGHRPCLPDSLPVIGESKRLRGVYYAFGHQHVGMVTSPATARVVSQIILGDTPEFDVTPFRPDRF